MSFYHKGNPHKIAAMASKSCNAVSSRDLYVPLTATVNVNEQARTFTIDIVATCYFGTRINIQNIFTNMVINGQSVDNKTINAWVSKDEPGKEIARTTINGTFNYEGVPSITNTTIPFSGKMTYFKDVGCTQTNEISFQNEVAITVANIDPYYTQPAVPTINNVTSLDTALLVDVSTASFGEGGGKYLYVEASKTNDFEIVKTSTPISELSGTCRVPNLQPNTFYYIRAVCANNGLTSYGEPQKVATLARSEITRMYVGGESIRVNDKYAQRFDLDAVVVNGGRAHSVKTYTQRSQDGVNFSYYGFYPNTPYVDVTNIHDLNTIAYPGEQEFKYFRLETVTEAGTFYSPVYYADIPDTQADDAVWGIIESITTSGSTATVKYRANSRQSQNLKITVYYRPYGLEEEWLPLATQTYPSGNPVRTAPTITGLIPNYAIYEISLHVEGVTSKGEFDSEPYQFFTIPTQVSNDTCDSLDYMVQLICQTYNAIKQGNITIYMNDDTKQWCEGEDGIPTLASIMSRINRYMHAVGCVLCSMDGFIALLKESEPNQVFMGQMGWVDCDDEPIAGSVNPVLSDGVHAAIDELIRQVWHYMGDYDYFARNPLELNAQSGTATGQTAVMGDKVYTWNGSSWASARDIPHEDFGVIHINSGRYADHAFYWFVNDWNRLDADTDEIEARLDTLESLKVVQSIDGLQYKIALADSNLTKAQINALIPTDATMDTVIILTDPALEDETQVTILEGGN